MTDAIREIIAAIAPADESLRESAQARLDDLTKPRGSLGRLEEVALRLAMLQKGEPTADPARIIVAAGDHGVAAEGVSAFPQEVTRQMVLNFLAGGAGVNVLAKVAGVGMRVVDAGVAGKPFAEHPLLERGRVASGTANMTEGPAMRPEECEAAVLLGARMARQAAADGVRALATGDMGIANTTPSAALYCAMLGLSPEEVVGPGTGLDHAGVRRKVLVVEKALAANWTAVAGESDLRSGEPTPEELFLLDNDGPENPFMALAALGGLEIACLAGVILGGASAGLPVVVDGYISVAAYCAAWRMCPAVADWCFFSHLSAEPGHQKIMRRLDQKPLLDLGMRLGEGTGAALALVVLRGAAAIYNEMATFSGAGVSR